MGLALEQDEKRATDGESPSASDLPPGGRRFLDHLLRLRILGPLSLYQFVERQAGQLRHLDGPEAVGDALLQDGLLTAYQLDRLRAGTTHGLVLGNYRVLERLGAGNMGVVFLAEHVLMKRRAAVKVLPVVEDSPGEVLERFYGEIRTLADLHHPNIVLAYDAGEVAGDGPRRPALLYLVMEHVPGGDLEERVRQRGPAPVAEACGWVRQAACGLQEAHRHNLIHRDVKPSNLLLAADGQVKMVDFGLARHLSSRLTSPKGLLGTIEFMAPEQSRDPTGVGAPADIYGLGASLFWLLTGEPPHPHAPTMTAAIQALQQQPPRQLSTLRRDAPAALDALVARLLDPDPARRLPSPATVADALTPFAEPV